MAKKTSPKYLLGFQPYKLFDFENKFKINIPDKKMIIKNTFGNKYY